MPYQTPLGLNYDSGEFARNMDQALAAADLAGFPARRAEARARGRYRGLGHAVYIEQSGFPPDEFAELRFDPSGTLTILMGTQSSGQGHQTAYTQLAVERLGVAPEKVRVLQGDTAAISFGRGTGGSRSIPVGGAALAAGRRQADRQGPAHRRASVRGGRGRCRIRRWRLHGCRHRSPARHRGGGARRLRPGAAGARCRAGL